MRYAFGDAPAILHQNLRGKGKLGEKVGAGQKKLPPRSAYEICLRGGGSRESATEMRVA